MKAKSDLRVLFLFTFYYIQILKDTLEHTELDMDKLNQIYENWSQDDWEEFVTEKYGL